MQRPLAGFLILGMITAMVGAQNGNQPTAAPPPVVNPATAGDQAKAPPLYDEQADANAQIAAALKNAKKENRRVLIQWGGNWCVWCKRLHGLYQSDKEIARMLQYEYEVVYADSGRPNDKNLKLAESLGADLKAHGFPYLTILDADSKVLANQDTASLEVANATAAPWHDAKKVLNLLTVYQAPKLNAQKCLEAGLAQASQTDRRVFLHFGAPWCGWCRKLEAWMDRPDVHAILAKDFVDIKIDVDRMEGGKDVLAKFNRESTGGIPWIVLLDSKGEPLANSNGLKGNIGFPAQPDEIEHFTSMLNKAVVKMSAADISTLTESLATKKQAGPSAEAPKDRPGKGE